MPANPIGVNEEEMASEATLNRLMTKNARNRRLRIASRLCNDSASSTIEVISINSREARRRVRDGNSDQPMEATIHAIINTNGKMARRNNCNGTRNRNASNTLLAKMVNMNTWSITLPEGSVRSISCGPIPATALYKYTKTGVNRTEYINASL